MERESDGLGHSVKRWLELDSNPGVAPKFLHFLLYPAEENVFGLCLCLAGAFWRCNSVKKEFIDQESTG